MYLIDGYNLVHAARLSRDALIRLVEAHCARGGYRARIVFDATAGMRRREERGDLEIRTVAQGRTADEEILADLGSTTDATAYTLVSNDRELVREAEKRKMKVVDCESFLRAALAATSGAAPEKSEGASPGEVDYWMREFGLDEEERGSP
jgi:hypothetical protein